MLVVPSASLAEAVMPTRLPLAEFSARLLAAGLLSVTGVTSNSSTSVRLIVKFSVVKLPSVLVARMVMLCEVAASKLSSVPSATVTTPVLALIAKRSAGAIVQRVGDRVGRAVGVAGGGGDANQAAVGGVFGEAVGGRVTVADRRDVEFIDIGQTDREVLGREAAVGAGCPDGDAVRGGCFEVEQGAIGYADDAVELLIAKRPPALLSSE